MIPQSLDYARPARRRLPPGSLRFALAALVAVAILAMPFVSVRQTRSRIDAVTGSMEWQTTWPFGITAGPKVTPSELELRMTRLGIPWTRRWVFLHNTHRTLFGTATVRECGVAPPIYSLKSLLPQYARVATASELRTFVGVMQNGTDAQQNAAVQAAADEALR